MGKNQKGFSAVEGLLIFVIVAIIGGVGWFVWDSNNKSNASLDEADASNASVQALPKNSADPNAKYLEIKELGVKFQLTDKISDAYYHYDKGTNRVSLSVHRLDNVKSFEGCTAKGEFGDGIGTVNYAKPGETTQDEGVYTEKQLQDKGWLKAGGTYYWFESSDGSGYVSCWDTVTGDVSNSDKNVKLAKAVFAEFQKQFKTIVSL